MNFRTILISFLPWFSFCLCEIAQETQAKLLTDFINYYNLLPNQNFKASEGFLQSVNQIDPTTFNIEVTFSQQSDDGPKLMKCTATVQDVGEKGIAIVNNVKECGELVPQVVADSAEVSVEEQTEREPIKLENEVQADTAITSGEQFIAIPRDHQATPCIGCASHVNPQAAGVSELANYGIRHLDLHEPTVKHSLDTVIDVERQVQVVNGVRYILTLSVNDNNCTDEVTDSCATTKVCKISILVKPWQTLPGGGKYRAILANNCTEEWQFGDNGEVLPEPINNPVQKEKDGNSDDVIKAERNEDVQSQPNQDGLSLDKKKEIEDQIIPYDQAKTQTSEVLKSSSGTANEISKEIKDHIIEDESVQQHNDGYSNIDTSTSTTSSKPETGNLSSDKKKIIDEMLDFFDFSGFKPQGQDEIVSRVKRNYDHDLEVLTRAEEFYDLKKSITNAKYIYEMAQVIVDYLNEMDFEVKNRVLKNVLKAEEEEDNGKHFVYIQLQIVIPCETTNCESKESETKICNGVIDSTNRNSPQILNSFCYIDTKEMEALDKIKEVPIDDQVLLRLAKEALRKIESESADSHALIINRIVSAITRVASGRVTKISMIIEHLNCNKSIPLVLRSNCSVLEYLGSSICEVIVHGKHWLKERKIIYTCTERPVDMTISKLNQNANIMVDDPKIIEILQEALHYLEMQSNEKNQLTLVRVNKITTQVITGFLIDIEFTIGYTNCTDTNDLKSQLIGNCELLSSELLRNCKAQIWDRSWIVEGRQMDVFCDNDTKIKNTKQKRSLSFVGGQKDQNVNDPKFFSLAEESLQKYLLDNSIAQPHRILRLDKVSTQVVAGSLTKIDFTATQSDAVGGGSISCHSEIWEKSWQKFKNIDVSCAQKRDKRGIAGGETVRDVSDPKYLSLAEESLQKYLLDNSIAQPHRILRLEKVSTQVVAGSLTRIDFIATRSDVVGGGSMSCHSEIWEKSWQKFKNIDVSCAQKRDKREIAGGETVQDVSDPKYLSLAEESLQKYLLDNSIAQPHRILRLEKVSTQVVAGSLTRIDFIATRSDVVGGGSISCHSEIWEKSWQKFKNIDVSCAQKRDKREIAGGETVRDVSDPKYLSLAEESLQKYLLDNSIAQPHRILRLEKVSTQVVAGSLTRIDFVATRSHVVGGGSISCHSEIWEKSWQKFKNIVVSCAQKRDKREIPGGETVRDVSDPKYLSLAEESLQKYLLDNSIAQPHRILRLEKVSTQVVAGSLTRIDFVATRSDVVGGGSMSCHSEIWEKSWQNFKNIVVSCAQKRDKREIAGGETVRDVSDPKYLSLAEESLQKYLLDNSIAQPHRILRLEKVSTQVVAGSLTRIDFIATRSDVVGGGSMSCHSEIWEKSWQNFKNIVVSCAQKRDKREIAGGETVRDVSDPKYLSLAEESLQKYLLDNSIAQPHRILRLEKVSTQVVAGSLTRIDFVATRSDVVGGGSISCHSKIWEKSWQKFKNIDVSCAQKRDKSEIAGGETVQDVSDPKYLSLAEESLQKYLLDNSIAQPHRILRLEKVSTQVVAGSLTRIDFVATRSDVVGGGSISCHSEIWEKSWQKFKNIDVSCAQKRDKRGIAGGETVRDVSDPKYLSLAEESLQKYLLDNSIAQPHRILRLEKVSTQVVAGSLTRIDFVATRSDVVGGGSISCHSEIWEKSWQKFKNIVVSCAQKRDKREIAGGETVRDVSDPKYLSLAEESLQKYLLDNSIAQPHRILRLEKVSTQVVAGSLTRIDFIATRSDVVGGGSISCHSEIWEKSWQKFKNIDVSCAQKRDKREIAGGETVRDVNDPKYLSLAEESLQKYLLDNSIAQPHRILRLEKVSTQVVAGSLTRIDFVATRSDVVGGGSISCHSEIWEKSWQKFKNIVVSCAQKRDKREIPGGETVRDVSDPKYLSLAEESLQKYLLDNSIAQPHRILRLEKVSTQVVAGSLTRIDFVATRSDVVGGGSISCHSEIWEKSWQKFKNIVVSCAQKRDKREIPGGETVRDVSDPKYLSLAEESLQKYLLDNSIAQPHRILRLEKVSTQVVAGSLTRIDFVATRSDVVGGGSISCHSEIWEKSWQKFKNIDVSCAQKRDKREIAGGETVRDVSDPKYLSLAEESLQKYLLDNSIAQPHRILRLEKVSTQVVAGSLTRIDFVATRSDVVGGGSISCHSEIWEKSWQKFKNIVVSCAQKRDKREIPGGETVRDVSDPKYLSLAEESLQKYLLDNSIAQPHRILRLEKVSTQVVAGSLTRIDFVATRSDVVGGGSISCHSEIWEKSWQKFKNIDVSCAQKRDKREIAGGETVRDVSDPKYLSLAEESLQKYLLDNSIAQPHRILRLEKVSTQVVAGSLTRIDFVATRSDVVGGGSISCHSEIWEKSWQKFKNIVVSCAQKRDKREIPGGETVRDVSDPKYLSLAEESLQKYLLDNSIAQPHRILRLEKVSTQVVAGSLTRIDFVATRSDVVGGGSISCHSEIWEKSWQKFKNIDVSCAEKRDKREIAGGETVQDVSDPKYLSLAEESLQKYLLDNSIAQPHRILRLEKVSTQVVAGSLTRIDFVATRSDVVGGGSISCHSEIWEKSWQKFKNIDVSCAQKRDKREIAGGETVRDVNDPKYLSLAEESLQKYLLDNSIAQPHRILRLEKVSTQVVAGSLTRIDFVATRSDVVGGGSISCHSEIWEKSWQKFKNIDVSCAQKRDKREIPGGETVRDVSDPKYLSLAEESLQKYLLDNSIAQPHRILRLEKVSTQVVAGSLTRIDFVATRSDVVGGGSISCHSEIWEKSWQKFKNIVVSCAQKRDKREIPGGETVRDVSDPKYLSLAEESLQKYLLDNSIAQPHRILRLEKVSTQVVAGSLTRIDFVATRSDVVGGGSISCHSEIWEKSWQKFKNIVVSCAQKRDKREIPGGETVRDVSDPKYLSLAEESLQKYLLDNSIAQPHRILRLEKVSTQVVAGSLTRIDFVATRSHVVGGGSISCHSEIWEKSWQKFKNIVVSCAQKRDKREIPGGETVRDVSDPKYLSLAEESLQKYLLDNSIAQPHRILRLEKVSTQVVAGSLTRIDFVATRSDVVGGGSISCHSEIWEKSWQKFKNIDVSCAQKRDKREIAGGETVRDVSDPKYLSLAEESLQKYLLDNSIAQPHRILRLEKVSTQVVAGSLTRIDFVATRSDVVGGGSISCHSEIWEKSWQKFKNIVVSCAQKRDKREIPGGETVRDVSDPKYLSLAEESLQKYLLDNSIAQPHRILRLEKVSTQVVAGSLTRIDFVATRSDVVGGGSISCHSEIFEKLWNNFKNIYVSCNIDHKREKGMTFRSLGQEIERNPNDPKYLLLSYKSMKMHLDSIGDERRYKVIKVAKVTTQVVAGTLIRIFFVIRSVRDPEGPVTTCFSKIWERPWLGKESIKVKCVKGDMRNSLRILENVKNEDAQNEIEGSKYLQLAKESLQKYLLDSNIQHPHKVVHVEQVSTAVENGTITRLNFVVLPVNTSIRDVMNCYSEVKEHPFNEKKEIEVSCQLNSEGLSKFLPGNSITVNADNFKYLQLANDSLQKYLQDTGNSRLHRVTRLDRVTVQLDAGRTKIQFRAAPIDRPDSTMNCFSNVFEQTWPNKRGIEVICDNNDLTSRDKRTLIQGHDFKRYRNVEQEQDVTKPVYLLMAQESLNKYSKKVGILHKVLKVNHVTKRVVSGIMYKIDFSASATKCPYNVQNERFCEVTTNSTVYCNTEILDQSWKRKKRIKVNCDPDEVDYDHISGEETEESNGNFIPTFKLQQARMMQESKVYSLAKEAVEQYMDYSNKQYFHAITRIVSSKDHLASDGRIINIIRFSISPTICFKNESADSIDSCELKEPKVDILCEAKIIEQSWLKVEKNIDIKCNDLLTKKPFSNRSKRQTGVGQIDEDDNEIDEDTTYYYADRAVQHVNERTDANNLYKLITIHSIQTSVQMKTTVVKMYIEIAETYCLRHQTDIDLYNCEEMEGLNHRLCLVRVYPSPDDELVVRHVSVVCDDNDVDFNAVTGLNIPELLRLSIEMLEKNPDNHFKLVHQGEPQVIPSLDTKSPIKINFVVAITNCTKDVDLSKNPFQCYLDTTVPSRSCFSHIWLETKTRTIHYIDVKCNDDTGRVKRSLLDIAKNNSDSENIKELITAALEKLEMVSLHRYKQRVLHINSHSSKITSGKVTTIDFDVGYTSCLKYEWVENVTSCEFIEHLPRRHCVAQIWERLWLKNGRNIDVSCEDDETPLEAHIEFESAEMAMQLAREALKHIEAKYPHPKKQKIIRIFSLEKQAIAGIHYRMKVEVGFTDCAALSDQTDCKLENDLMLNKFCRVNVWVRPWTDHPPNLRVYCDFQEGATADMYHQVQAEQLFYNFLATYNPSYANDHSELERRFNIFKANIRKIHEMNVHEKGTATYGVTRFSDLSYKEFRARYMGFNMSMQHVNEIPMKSADIPSEKLPVSFDWRDFDAVTEVKDQGLCGSSWAFSVAGNIEGQWKMQSGQLVSLSEQQLLDCDEIDDGCSGGLPANAYRAIEQLGGLEHETDYPYEGESDKCLINTNLTKVEISGSVNISSNETGMAQWLVHNGPISVGINANAMQFYMGGIAHPWYTFCNRTDLDHGVLVVGFGVEEYPLFHKRLPYWIVKNSWGPSWGEQGYYRVYRGDGTCGVNQMATSAVI